MANPISVRPWSRLTSLRSPPAPDSLPKYQPAELSLKTTNTSSHDMKESATKYTPTTPDVYSPMQSQKLKLTTPMTFPLSKLKSRAQLEIKIALEEEVTNEKPNENGGSLRNESVENHGIGNNEKEVAAKGKCIDTRLSSPDSCGMRVITISGENKGAYMQITKPHKKPFHKMRAVYTNSNVQCVNNSIVLNTSLTHHDPGMHLVIPKKASGEGFHPKERCEVQRN
ncbi:unnamed protein product [Sphenostylis stenocarpa]|uniref:Uncharacterized protein n=1 Tax=Sphenostylis stenocarpa TaxID=92480 RepID=A0AA86VGA2_9FABA|nr:unnamed protein product [Sphenostylis stenocarpa]